MRLADLEEQGVEGDENTRRAREADDPTMYVVLAPVYFTALLITKQIASLAVQIPGHHSGTRRGRQLQQSNDCKH